MPSQTTHDHSFRVAIRVTVVRRHHPLLGRSLEVFSERRNDLVLCLPDGSRLQMNRAWTDVDGASEESPQQLTIFTVRSLRELISLTDVLKGRP